MITSPARKSFTLTWTGNVILAYIQTFSATSCFLPARHKFSILILPQHISSLALCHHLTHRHLVHLLGQTVPCADVIMLTHSFSRVGDKSHEMWEPATSEKLSQAGQAVSSDENMVASPCSLHLIIPNSLILSFTSYINSLGYAAPVHLSNF